MGRGTLARVKGKIVLLTAVNCGNDSRDRHLHIVGGFARIAWRPHEIPLDRRIGEAVDSRCCGHQASKGGRPRDGTYWLFSFRIAGLSPFLPIRYDRSKIVKKQTPRRQFKASANPQPKRVSPIWSVKATASGPRRKPDVPCDRQLLQCARDSCLTKTVQRRHQLASGMLRPRGRLSAATIGATEKAWRRAFAVRTRR
jgi:hypothetical protein